MSSSDKSFRQNFDKRTLRKRHHRVFKRVVRRINQVQLNAARSRRPRRRGGIAYTPPTERGLRRFSVYVRKRPIFDYEIRKREYDIVSTSSDTVDDPSAGPASSSSSRSPPRGCTITIHNCLFRPDLKIDHAYIESRTYEGFEDVFGSDCDNSHVYEHSCMGLVQYVLSGKHGVLFLFGQTGSGKTYTVTSMLEQSIADIFVWADRVSWARLSVSAFEMSGDLVSDLLNRREKLILRADGHGNIVVCGLREIRVTQPSELESVVESALASRRTVATKVNSVSSRSHCVIRIRIRDERRLRRKRGRLDDSDESESEHNVFAQLTLVDLAGSERKEDSMFHEAGRISESRKINTSLMALKDCIRVYHQNLHSGAANIIPYRVDKLCMLLKECFDTSNDTRTVVIATVSPNPTDTEHSLSTLKNTCLMNEHSNVTTLTTNVCDVMKITHTVIAHPQKWDLEQTRKWLTTVDGGRYSRYVDAFPSQTDGKALFRMSKKRVAQICGGNMRVAEGIRAAFLREVKKHDDAKGHRRERARALRGGGRS